MALTLVSAGRLGTSRVGTLATLCALGLTGVGRRCYLMALTLVSAGRLGASKVGTLTADGTDALAFMNIRNYKIQIQAGRKRAGHHYYEDE